MRGPEKRNQSLTQNPITEQPLSPYPPFPADLDRLGGLLTEQSDSRFQNLDVATVTEIALLMNEADATVPAAVRAALPSIVVAIEGIAERLAAGGRLCYVGAGSAGRIGVLDAAECPPTFSTPPELVQGIMAGGTGALLKAREGIEDDTDAGRSAIAERKIGPADAVVGVAASGRTPFVLAAVAEARRRGALTVGLACNPGADLSEVAEYPIEVLVGPEVIAGSTRLKAGTAQKLVLNMISTIAMVRLGKTYGNLMVDLRITNAKLRQRAIRIIERITGVDRDRAEQALTNSQGDIKLAVLILRHNETLAGARRRLAMAGGRLRLAMDTP